MLKTVTNHEKNTCIGLPSASVVCKHSETSQLYMSFNVYGVTDYDQRFKFDPASKTAKDF
jgi:hypothetical protein